MAYFPNGSSGDYYESKYCEHCVHYGDFGEKCPILKLHILWNYDACNGNAPDATAEASAKHTALNTLWPCEGSHNAECAMFYEKPNNSISGQRS